MAARLAERKVLLREMQARMIERILYVPFDHLNRSCGVLKNANRETDHIVLVQSQRMTTGRPWHNERLFFLVSSARHFATELEQEGFKVSYIKAATTIDGLKQVQAEVGELPIWCAEPSSFVQFRQLKEFGVNFVENDLFLTSRSDFALWAGRQKSFVMENFYRAQRIRLGILMDGSEPVGGRWNFDADNRLPPPKNYTWPPYIEHQRDEIDLEVAAEFGMTATKTWATTRTGALAQLANFVEHHLDGFGPYEDASTTENWALHHSLLSPYLNNGLLHASEAIEASVAAFHAGKARIESVEAFVRQVIGWREYINGMYWYLGEDYKYRNGLAANRKLLPLFTDSSKTSMNCMKTVVGDVEARSWAHHIPRLMILSNLALITGTNPQEFLDWMREQFIDAAEWVMVPNIIGMGVHADGGQLMTKPYAAGGAYISRMTNFCKGCAYDPKLRVGDNACPFTTLYWDFLDRHKEAFAKNHRMAQQVNGLKRLTDLPELRVRAQKVLTGLEQGVI
jgi:deoxyribodipyrimidine photolyase-related protein